jgi:hypothetical protein
MKNSLDQKINAAQNEVLNNCVKEAKKMHNKEFMKMHEISKLHAEALLNVGNIKVYGFTSSGFVLIPSISELTNFEQYFID